MRPFREAEPQTGACADDEGSIARGDFLTPELSLASSQQKVQRSMGPSSACLSEQEIRVARFHEVLNDYTERRR